MPDELKPALTPEEWRLRYATRDADREFADTAGVNLDGYVYVAIPRSAHSVAAQGELLPVLAALANHALPADHPLKITRADVALLREAALNCEEGDFYTLGADVRAIAAKLAALLPPE